MRGRVERRRHCHERQGRLRLGLDARLVSKRIPERILKATGIDDCTVVTWDDERTTEDGIRIVPAWKWLLAEAAS